MILVSTRDYEKALKRLRKLGASDVDIDTMERAIAANPEAGDVIAGSGGLRKVRFGYGGKGKSGGGRTIYYAVFADETVYLLTAFAKVDQADISVQDRRILTALAKETSHG